MMQQLQGGNAGGEGLPSPGGVAQHGGGGAVPNANQMQMLSQLLGGANAGGGNGGTGNAPDMSALMAMMQGLGGGGGGGSLPGAPAPVQNPEEAYATQLQQLRDMGFYDQAENVRALQAAGGNVNAAVERLLAAWGST